MTPLRAAVIGCGMIGSAFADDPRARGVYSHAAAYSRCPDTTLVAVCDSDPASLERCASRWGVSATYLDAAALLSRERPDIVSICTPDETHAQIARIVLESQGIRGVLVEKPIATDYGSAATTVALAERRGVALAVNYVRRYSPTHIEMREWISAGGIGDVQAVSGIYTKGTLHNGTHWLDLARFLIGDVAQVWGFDFLHEGGVDPTLDAVIRFERGSSGHLQACAASAYSVFEMDVVGTTGRIRIVESGHRVEIYRVGDSPYYTGYRALVDDRRIESNMTDLTLRAVQDLVDAVREGRQTASSGRDGLAALQVALAVKASALTGRATVVSAQSVA